MSEAPKSLLGRIPSFREAFVHTCGASAVSMIFTLLTSALIARALQPAGRGHFSLVLASIQILHPLSGILNGGNDVLLGESLNRKSQLIRQALLGDAGYALVATLLLLLAPSRVAEMVIGQGDTALLLLFGVTLCLYSLENDLRTLLAAYQRFAFLNRADVAFSAVYLTANYAVARMHLLSVTSAVVLFLISRLSLVGIYLLKLRSESSGFERSAEHDDAPLLWKAVRIGWRSFVISIAVLLLMRVDIWLLGAQVGMAELGIYSVASGLASLTAKVSSIMCNILKGKAILEKGGEERALLAVKLVFVLGLVGITSVWLLGRPLLVFVFGKAYEASYGPWLILSVAFAFWSTGNTVAGFVCARKKYPMKAAVWMLCAVAVNILLNVLWIPGNGSLGAAYAALVSYAVGAVGWLFQFYETASLPAKRFFLQMGRTSRL